MSKRAEQAAGKIHSHALLEAEKYAASHAGSIVEEVAYGRGFKAGFIEGYQQAEKDINREMLDRMNEIHEKQAKAALEDLNYTVKIDPALGFDEGSVVVYHGKELINVLTWEDMKIIFQIITTSDWSDFEINGKLWSDEFYEEVLKRFKETKG